MSKERIYDKINYQTNFTAPSTFAILLKVIDSRGIVDSETARKTLFPQARSSAGMRYDPTIRDTHGEITLAQYKLIDYVTDTTFKLSALGARFLELFDEDFKAKNNNEFSYVSTMLDTLLSWKDNKYGRNINVGILLLKLLLEKKMEYYITAEEFSFVAEFSGIKKMEDYDNVLNKILENRMNNIQYPLKKADVLLGGFAGAWKLLEKYNDNNVIKYKLREITKLIFSEKLAIMKNLSDKNISFNCEEMNRQINEINRLHTGTNIILYGVPGSGKSWTIENEYCKYCGGKERLVFHPDYTYADFVGQILPKVDIQTNEVTYKFVEGPFTKIVKEAYENPDKEYFLIIEEINRGNAPAIFGDVFQLLDRDSNGQSAYGISNADMARIIYGDENHKVRIPSNMSILATMNTSDQNVFTLDTAFQRRWHMRLIENVFKKVESDDVKKFAETKIMDTTVTWETFCTKLNEIILNRNVGMTSAEDKRLGTHFITAGDLVFISNPETMKDRIQNSRFAEKVIKYLWDDAFKFSRDEIFNSSNNSLEKVIKSFMEAQANERFNIFVENIKKDLLTILESSKKDDE